MSDNDIFWRVLFLDKENGRESVEGLFKTEEEALRRSMELSKKRRYNDSFDIYPLDNDWEYKVESVTRREVMEVRKKQYEELMAVARERFWSHCDEHFEDCCRELLSWLAERITNMTDEELRLRVKKKQVLYAPWRSFYGESKVFALVSFKRGGELVLAGQFAGKSLFGTIIKDIRHFSCREDYLEWTGCLDDATVEFVAKMREERYEEYEQLLQDFTISKEVGGEST